MLVLVDSDKEEDPDSEVEEVDSVLELELEDCEVAEDSEVD